MAFTVTVTLGYTPNAGVPMSVADFIALGLPNVSVTGAAGTADISDGAITWAKLSPTLLATPSLTTVLGDDDRVFFHDASTNSIAVMDIEVFGGQLIGNLASYGSFQSYTADEIPFYRSVAGDGGTMTPAVLAEQLIEQAPALTTTADEDLVLVVDASAVDSSRARQVTLANLLPDKIAANTYVRPTSVKVDAKGRVMEILTTGQGQRTSAEVEAYQIAMPSAAGYANATSLAHGLTAKPKIVCVQLTCTDAGGDAGYAQNDVIGIDAVAFDTGASDYAPHYVVFAEAADIKVVAPSGTAYIANKTTGADATFTPSKWKWSASATR